MCLDKKKGGLGIRNLSIFYKASFANGVGGLEMKRKAGGTYKRVV